ARRNDRRLVPVGGRLRARALLGRVPAPGLARRALLLVDDDDAAPAAGRGSVRLPPAPVPAEVRDRVGGGRDLAGRELRRLLSRFFVLRQPGLRLALVRAGQPGSGDEVGQLAAVDLFQVRDADQDGVVTVPVRRREEDAAGVGEDQLLLLGVRDAQDEDVLEPLAGLGVDRVRPGAAVEAE